MKLTLRTRHLDVRPDLRAQLARSVERALRRHAPQIHEVEIAVADINGPRGGADKQCRIRVRGPELCAIAVHHLGADLVSTVLSAAARAERAIARALARRRAFAAVLAT